MEEKQKLQDINIKTGTVFVVNTSFFMKYYIYL